MSDDELKDVDLSAWDVPPPEMSADELADGVIARLEGTDVGAAIPVEPSAASPKKRALLIAGVAAAVLAAVIGGWTIVKGTKHEAPRDGAVVAAKAQSIELDGAHADLDAGADVRWKREGNIVRVEQRTGSAAWRVGTDRKLVIDAGAASASVEATGASLRVEVKPMNAADVRLAGALTATAALVAIVVYEGHVKVHDTVTQQTVIVQPGSTYTVQPAQPIVDDEPVVGVAPIGADQTPEVTVFAGTTAVIHDMAPPTRVKVDINDVCEKGQPELVINGVKTSSDQFAFNRGTVKYDVTCNDISTLSGSITVVRDSLVRPMPGATPVNEINTDGRTYRIAYQSMPSLEVHGGPGTLHVSHGSSEKTYEAKGESVLVPSMDLLTAIQQSTIDGPGGDELKVWFTPDKMSTVSLQLDTSAPIVSLASITWGPQIELAGTTLASSVLDIGSVTVPIDRSGRFKISVPGGGDTLVLRIQTLDAGLHYAVARANAAPVATNAVTVAPANCDAAVEKEKGMENVNIGQHAAALAHFEASLACKDDSLVRALAYMSACNSMNEPKARLYYGKMTAAEQVKYLPMCVRNHIDPSVGSTCDADALKNKGIDFVKKGQHAVALAQFEASLRCQDDAFVAELAVTTACNAKNEAKAKLYLPKLGATRQIDMATICKRNGITLTTSTSCDADALKDKGMENVNMGQHAAALQQFEASLRCKQDAQVIALAFMEACNSQNSPKARLYYRKMSGPEQSRFKALCIRNHIDPADGGPTTATDNPTTAPATCDADALKDKGMEAVNLGKHATALDLFEKSLACKDDGYVVSLAFMAACNAQDGAKAKAYYAKLSPKQQSAYRVMCERNKVDVYTGEAMTASGTGYLEVTCQPEAKVLIDGKDTGLTTPVKAKKLPLEAGRHKLTLVVGDDRFTYPFTIEGGKTVKMSKDLR